MVLPITYYRTSSNYALSPIHRAQRMAEHPHHLRPHSPTPASLPKQPPHRATFDLGPPELPTSPTKKGAPHSPVPTIEKPILKKTSAIPESDHTAVPPSNLSPSKRSQTSSPVPLRPSLRSHNSSPAPASTSLQPPRSGRQSSEDESPVARSPAQIRKKSILKVGDGVG